MIKTIRDYIPFEHKNLEYKQKIISIALQEKKELRDVLTSTLIYVNTVDYIASFLLENLTIITHLLMYSELNGVVFRNYPSHISLPLGEVIKLLKKYEFPDKEQFIQELVDFNQLRTKYVHKLLSDEPTKIDQEWSDIEKLCLGLIERFDTISRGITDAWNSRLNRISNLTSQSSPSENEPAVVYSNQEKTM